MPARPYRSRPVTMRQVAEACGMSVPSVSQILNRKGWYRPETRERVIETAQRLGYRPNAFAQAMTQGSFGNIGLLLATVDSRSPLPRGLLDGIEGSLAERSLHLTVSRLPDEQLSDAGHVPKLLQQLLVDGLLINYHHRIPPAMLELVREHRLPLVWLNVKQPSDAVYPDDQGLARLATEQLLALGHRRIAFCSFNTPPHHHGWHYSHLDRLNGYMEAMRLAGLEPRFVGAVTEHVDFGLRVGMARGWLREPERPTAFVAYSEASVVPLQVAAIAEGLETPRDVSFISFNDGPVTLVGPRVTVADIPFLAVGQLAVQMLMARIESGKEQPSVAVPGTIIEGETVGPPPA